MCGTSSSRWLWLCLLHAEAGEAVRAQRAVELKHRQLAPRGACTCVSMQARRFRAGSYCNPCR